MAELVDALDSKYATKSLDIGPKPFNTGTMVFLKLIETYEYTHHSVQNQRKDQVGRYHYQT